jgi:F-type H+-transporting ATPase subunit gamma
MASGKEIRTKIGSVKNTQKITKAMQMVAASKLRRTQQRMEASRPYAERIRTVIGHLSEANPDYRHPYLRSARRQARRLHHHQHRPRPVRLAERQYVPRVVRDLRKWQDQGVEADLCLIGAKGMAYFRRLEYEHRRGNSHLGECRRSRIWSARSPR